MKLSDQEVKSRTDITVKMANAAGESAETVSDQLTAVWNNFYDGSKSLEYYADVMTKLGAATASSTDEIATGLEKFASIAETVGLSYEYAASALATVTDKTRQSADVVGTAFKTIFQRIEGLELGETLEDGTTLNEYSEALAVVGVNIKDANDELKDMDVILNEMAAVWGQLNRDEQVALAQKVAGARQYNQLMSLMNNWDFMEENIATSYGSSGALQEQANIYAESWEAARDRVTAAAEAIYSDLINDEFFIDITNGFEHLLVSLDGFIDGMGGVKTIIVAISSLLLSSFASKIPDAINNLKANFGVLFGSAHQGAQELTKELIALNQQVANDYDLSTSSKVALDNATALATMKNKMAEVQDKLNAKEKQQFEQEINILQIMEKEVQALGDEVAQRQASLTKQQEEIALGQGDVRSSREAEEIDLIDDRILKKREAEKYSKDDTSEEATAAKKAYNEARAALREFREETELMGGTQEYLASTLLKAYAETHNLKGELDGTKVTAIGVGEAFEEYSNSLQGLADNAKRGNITKTTDELKNMQSQIQEISGNSLPEVDKAFEKVFSIKAPSKNLDAYKSAILELKKALEQAEVPSEEIENILTRIGGKSSIKKFKTDLEACQKAEEKLGAQQEKLNKLVDEFNPTHVATGLEKLTSLASGLGSLATSAMSLKSAFSNLFNEDLSGGEKIVSLITGLSAAIPGVISGIKSLNILTQVEGQTLIGTIALRMSYNKILKEEEGQELILAAVKGLKKGIDEKNILNMLEEQVVKKKLIDDNNKETFSLAILNAAKKKTSQSSKEEALSSGTVTLARVLENIATKGLLATLIELLSVSWPLLLAIGGIATAIGIMVGAINKANEAQQKDVIAAQKAKEAAEQLAEGYETAKQKYKEMISTMENYKTAKEGLEELEKGTQEYKDKLSEANEEALKLIKLLGLLEGEGFTIENGEIVINTESEQYKNAISDAYKKQQEASATSTMADAQKEVASAKASLTAVKQEQIEGKLKGKFSDNSQAVTLNNSYASGQILNSSWDGFIQDLVTQYSETGNAIWAKEGIWDNLTFDRLDSSGTVTAVFTDEQKEAIKAGVEEYVSSLKGASDASKIAASALLEIDEATSSSENRDSIEKRVATTYEDTYNSSLEKISQHGLNKSQAEDVFSQYMKDQGIKDYEITKTDREGNITYKYTDDEGKKHEDIKFSNQAAYEYIAGGMANEVAEVLANNLTVITDGLDGIIDQSSSSEEALNYEGAKAGILQDYSQFNSQELESLQDIADEDWLELIFGENYKNVLEGLGFEDAEQFLEGFKKGVEEQQTTIQEQLNTLTNPELHEVGKQASSSAIENIAKQRQEAENINEGNGELFESNINSILDTIDPKDQVAAFEALSAIDWSKITAPQDAIDALEKLGINSEKTEEKILSLTGSMRELNGTDLNDLNDAVDPDIDKEEYEALAQHIKSVAKESKDFSKDLRTNEKEAKKVAEAILRYDKAVERISESYDNWNKALKSGNLQDQAEAVAELRNTYADMLDIDMDSLSDEFIQNTDNLALMKQAAEGSEEAYQKLQRLAGEDILLNINVDPTQYEEDLAKINSLSQEFNDLGLADLEAGASLNNEDFLNGLTDIVNASHMTAQEATDYLATMGIDAEVQPAELEQTEQTPVTTLTPRITTQPWTKKWDIPFIGEKEFTINVPRLEMISGTTYEEGTKKTVAAGVKVTSANKSSGGNVKFNNASHSSGNSKKPSSSSGSKGSGSGSSSSPAEKKSKTQKSDVVDRYKKLDEAISDNTRALEKANKQADRLYGAARIKAMKEVNKHLAEENSLIKKKIAENKKYEKEDKTDLNKAAKEAGISFKYDKDGNITNYESQMTKLYNKLSKAEEQYNKLSTKEEQDAFKKKTLDPINEQIEAVKEAYEKWYDTKELGKDLNEQFEDNLNEIADNKLEMLQYTVELKLEVDDSQLKALEFRLKQLENKEFSSAKRIALYQKEYAVQRQNAIDNRQGASDILKQMGLNADQRAQFFAGEEVIGFDWSKVTSGQMDALKQFLEGATEATEALMELSETAHEEVLNAFEEWSEELEEQIELFEHYNTVIESYNNIVDLAGQKRLGISNEQMKEINDLKVTNATNKLATSKSYYDEVQGQVANGQNQLAAAKERYEKYKKNNDDVGMQAAEKDIKYWEDYIDTVNKKLQEAQEGYLSDWEIALQTQQEAFMANAKLEIQELEEQMAGAYGSISAMQEEFDRNSTISERYLDDYERMYELNKLNRDLSQKMDETSNIKAKKELAKLQEEILSYQQEGRMMSEYDLEYLQKKYDLRVAEIAMEEAQNAKSQVRLTRDAEGNYSYTYTADEDSMADAKQTYEDKLYEITNLSNNYIKEQTSNLLATEQEYLDALAEIQEKASQGLYATTEEYNKALDECTQYYALMMEYYGGEVDKASLNNAVIYARDYVTYEDYIGKKLSAQERQQLELDADIAESEAKTQKLQIEYQAARDTISYQYAQGIITDQAEYEKAMTDIDTLFNNELEKQKDITKGLVIEKCGVYKDDEAASVLASNNKLMAEKGFSEGIAEYLPDIKETHTTATGYVEDMVEAIIGEDGESGYLGKAKQGYSDFNKQTDEIMKAAGTSMADFGKDSKKVLTDKDNKDSIINQTNKTKESFEELAETVNKALGDALTALTNFEKTYSKSLQNLINKNTAFLDGYAKVIEVQAGEADAERKGEKKDTSTTDDKKKNDTSGSGGSKSSGTSGNDKVEVGDIVTLKKGSKYYYDSYGTKITGSKYAGVSKGVKIDKIISNPQSGQNYYIHIASADGKYKDLGWVRKKDISGFDTGGYTGAWGASGKLAMLHEKELVLNKTDTQNMLKMISIVRDLASQIDLQAYNLNSAYLKAQGVAGLIDSNSELNQNVMIQAEFPNAVYADEIETALNNLVNSAAQYANRKY